jgi:hypothetical protein
MAVKLQIERKMSILFSWSSMDHCCKVVTKTALLYLRERTKCKKFIKGGQRKVIIKMS